MLTGLPSLDVSLTFSWPVAPTPAPAGRYFRILRDYETDEFGGGVRPSVVQNGGEPATIKSRDDYFVPMDKDFQLWFYQVWSIFAPPEMAESTRREKWAGFWESHLAWTNFGHGSDVCADYVNGTHLDAAPMAKETLTARGNIVRLADGFTSFSDKWWPFVALSPSNYKQYTPAEFAGMWWLCHLATIQNVTKFTDGTYQVDRFPHLSIKDRNIYRDVPVPLLSRDGIIYFDKTRLVEVPARVSPYNPARPFSPDL